MKPINEFRPTPRVPIVPGSAICLIGGGGELGYRLRGPFRAKGIWQHYKRIYLDVYGIGASKSHTTGWYTVFVSGKPYRRHGILWKPYKVKRILT